MHGPGCSNLAVMKGFRLGPNGTLKSAQGPQERAEAAHRQARHMIQTCPCIRAESSALWQLHRCGNRQLPG